jgi:hypothetical protein
MPRYAFKVTQEVIGFVAELLDEDEIVIPGNEIYVVMEMIGPLEINAKFMSTSEVLEEYKKDSTLQVLN